MPVASTSSGRRSVNTSRGRPGAAVTQTPSTSNGRRQAQAGIDDLGDEADSNDEDEAGERGRGEDSGSRHIPDVQTVEEVLAEFERQPHHLQPNIVENEIKSRASAWKYVDENVETTIRLMADVAERRCDVLEITEAYPDNDARLNTLEQYCRDLLDTKVEGNARQEALQTIREKIQRGEQISDAAGLYRELVIKSVQAYRAKTQRQKYASSKVYEKYRKRTWEATHDDDDPMPPVNELIPAEDGDEGEEDDDIAVYGASNHEYRCPITQQIMVDPVRSTVCPHAFERAAIYEMLGSATKPCPSCQKRIRKSDLQDDAELAKSCKSYARRVERRRERMRSQHQTAVLD